VAFLAALAYGIAGFWLLDPRQFGINFTLPDAITRTIRFLSLAGDPGIVPHTRHARWFLDSLSVMTATTIGYSLWTVFRPVLYRFRTLPHERLEAEALVRRHGRSAQDFFKTWPDKSLFFSDSRRCFLAYRVGHSFAIALGDPVGPEEEIEATVREFAAYCRGNSWGHGFHQTLPDFLPIYHRLGYRKLKVGDDAIVELEKFDPAGKSGKKLRSRITQLEKQGITSEILEPPIASDVLRQAREVSDAWLTIPGRRERRFTLGLFEPRYLAGTPVLVARDAGGSLLGFANLIPSYAPGEVAIDLMRHRPEAPNGVMDFIFVKLLLHAREKGFARFNLGMAPMSGFQEHEEASREERAVHYFIQQMGFLFSFAGLRHYKAKFATRWEPRYSVFQNVLELPRLAVALRAVSEIREARDE
jgi:phosphatidylglycerol lysyltransferase